MMSLTLRGQMRSAVSGQNKGVFSAGANRDGICQRRWEVALAIPAGAPGHDGPVSQQRDGVRSTPGQRNGRRHAGRR